VAHHKTDLGMARNNTTQAAGATGYPEGNGAGASPPSSGGAALRFRRGARAPLRPLELPLVGMVQVDDEPRASTAKSTGTAAPEAPAAAARPAGRRGRAGGKTTKVKDEAKVEAVTEPNPAGKPPRRPRSKKRG
jgi:hypothetical protein